ncbi:MAG: hypothetical protein ACO3N7_03640 [Kiritimatiellia bacterium]
MPNLPKASAPDSPRKKKGCLKPALLVLLVLAVVLHFTFSGIATRVANQKLPELLQSETEIGHISLSLLLGRVGIQNLRIAQPEGFNGEDLLTLDHFSVRVPPAKAAGRNPVEIRKVSLDGLKLNAIVDTNLVLNLSRLGPPPPAEPAKEIPPSETATAEPSSPLPLWVNELLLENIQINFTDFERDGWTFSLSDLRIGMNNIQVDYVSGKGPGMIQADLNFPDGKEVGKLKLLAKVGPVTLANPDQPPPVQIALGVIGFDLDLLKPFLVPNPTVAKTAFGGEAFDFVLFMNLDAGTDPALREISGNFELRTNSGTTIDDKLGGTLAEPKLPFTTLFADILGNQFGRVTKLGGNVAKGGLEAGKAVADTGVTAVKGVGKAAGGLVGGVFKTAKGVVTLDGETAMGGLKDATVGTASDLTGTVVDTAGAAAEGVGNTAGAVSGSTKSKIWWSEIDKRMQTFEETADQWFSENPFPSPES